MPGWLWDTVFQYPMAEGDTRTQYSDGSTFVGPLKDGVRHGRGGYFFQDGSRYVVSCDLQGRELAGYTDIVVVSRRLGASRLGFTLCSLWLLLFVGFCIWLARF